jgi:hypothetical protein
MEQDSTLLPCVQKLHVTQPWPKELCKFGWQQETTRQCGWVLLLALQVMLKKRFCMTEWWVTPDSFIGQANLQETVVSAAELAAQCIVP